MTATPDLPDLTHTPELERALLAAIITGSEDAILSKTLDGIVTSWNPAAERLFGWKPEEMIGQPVLRLIPRELHYEEADILARLRAGERIERYETMRVRKDGSTFFVSLTISPIRDAPGRIVGASKIAHDITERRRADAARQEAEKLLHLKDEFLATLSHELRTPLAAVSGWTHILLQGQLSPDQHNALTIIDRNARVQTRIIDDLLDMSRIVSGKIMLDVQSLALHEVIGAAIDTVRQAAEAKKIRLTALLDSTIGGVRGDANRLQQVLWNVLTNAIKFTPNGGRVQVVLERVNSHVEISVEDSGIGIPAEFLPHIFDRFRQADATTTRRHGGLGLGLSIVKSLVELHGGTVRAKSRGEHQGATFLISLPVAHVVSSADPAHRIREEVPRKVEEIQLPALDGANILVVDDEADGRALLVRILTDQGAQCTDAGSAAEALALLADRQFDILLSDVGMPLMDGYEMLARVRTLPNINGAHLPAIAITAYARAEDRQRSLLAGFHAHLTKPIEPRELIATVAGLLRLRS